MYHLLGDGLWPLFCNRAFFFVRLSALAKTCSFAILGLSVGWCELQMCMALALGFTFPYLIHQIWLSLLGCRELIS
jgi:hypothetical protein